MSSCAEIRELGPELALGALDGAERAEAMAHLAGCPECRAYVVELGEVADALLLALPEHDPPVGFESRVVQATRAPRSRRWMLAAAVAAVLVLVAGAVGLGLRERPAVLAGAMYDEHRQRVGYAAVYRGPAPFVSVRVDAWGESGTYDVELVLDDERHVKVGTVVLTGGRGSGGGPLGVPASRVQAVWVTDPSHTTWCAFRL